MDHFHCWHVQIGSSIEVPSSFHQWIWCIDLNKERQLKKSAIFHFEITLVSAGVSRCFLQNITWTMVSVISFYMSVCSFSCLIGSCVSDSCAIQEWWRPFGLGRLATRFATALPSSLRDIEPCCQCPFENRYVHRNLINANLTFPDAVLR